MLLDAWERLQAWSLSQIQIYWWKMTRHISSFFSFTRLLAIPKTRTTIGEKSFHAAAPKLPLLVRALYKYLVLLLLLGKMPDWNNVCNKLSEKIWRRSVNVAYKNYRMLWIKWKTREDVSTRRSCCCSHSFAVSGVVLVSH